MMCLPFFVFLMHYILYAVLSLCIFVVILHNLCYDLMHCVFVVCHLVVCFMTCKIMQWLFAFLLYNPASLLFYNDGHNSCLLFALCSGIVLTELAAEMCCVIGLFREILQRVG